ncbi:hypothetical protein J4226_05560 [Candidatus Pacearchaeota archaeon]|nr:hypothetical protein [Candidatus Pacearchaeota archaeon]
MDEETSLISMHPFVKKFVLTIVQTIREKEFEYGEKFVVDSDFVPKVSENVMRASMGMDSIAPAMKDVEVKPKIVKRDMSKLVAPIEPVVREMNTGDRVARVIPEQVVMPPIQVRQVVMPPKQVVMPPRQVRQVGAPRQAVQIAPPIRVEEPSDVMISPMIMSEGAIDAEGDYGKISPLLNDPSVSTIECMGEGKELMIIRAGQKQRTRIVLSAKEILGVLNRVADETHIPLLEGVFRASLEGFSINAVISEMVGSRFVIKKATAYGLLE